MKRVILHNIRSKYNVGAIFRSSDGSGVEKVYLSGHAPAPIDRFGRVVPEIAKTALGAEKFVAWESVVDIFSLLKSLRQEGFVVVAVEQSENSILLSDFKVPEKVVYILGSETEGIGGNILGVSDVVLELPMLGQKESLNVSVTAGVVLYHQVQAEAD